MEILQDEKIGTMDQAKLALITGGSRGLGKNIALSFAERGFDVILTYNSKKAEAQAVVDTIMRHGKRAAALQLNLADSRQFDSFIYQVRNVFAARFNRDGFDFLINNAGIGISAAYGNTTEDQFDMLVNIQQKGPFFLTQKLLPLLTDGGGIVNISSGLSRFVVPGFAAYAAGKGAMEVLTRYQAKELAPRGIRVNVVAPGAIETDFGGGLVRDNADANNFIASITALGRAGKPDDIGSVVTFLCTDDAKWINGQRIEVSGGMIL